MIKTQVAQTNTTERQRLARDITALPPRYLTTFQAAAYIGVTDRTIRQMMNDGRLKAYRLGDQVVRFRVEEIDAAFEAGAQR